ncbi:MAG: hypothetical protein FD155_1197 [Bacteroidetes bacterium]|nr:MAG: hypothetical protein FD155_1197 [Bacteroidota bacterium]
MHKYWNNFGNIRSVQYNYTVMKNSRLTLILFAFLVIITGTSCKKNLPDTNIDINDMTDLVVNPNFKWETTQVVNLNIQIDASTFLPLKSKISFYAGDPLLGAEKISSGSISTLEPYVGQLKIASYIKELYVELQTSTGSVLTEKVTIVNGQISFSFTTMKSVGDNVVYTKSVGDPGPECDVCDVVVSGTGSVTIKEGKTYCITDSFNGSVSFETWNGGGTLKVCGSATLSGTTTLGTNSHIVVTQNGDLTINSISMWGNNPSITVYANAQLKINSALTTTGSFTNHGQITINGSLVLQQLNSEAINNGTITLLKNTLQLNSVNMTNNGTITVPGYIHLNTNTTLQNYGTITAGNKMEINGSNFSNDGEVIVSIGYFNMNSGSKIINKGSIDALQGDISFNSNIIVENRGLMHAGSDIDINSASNVKNYCKMIADQKVEINSGQFNMINGYLKADLKITINGSSSINLIDASMVSTDILTMNASIYGSGTQNTVLAKSKIHINSNNVISGAVEAASEMLYISQNTPASQHIINGATFVSPDKMLNFIPVTACNPEGVGSEGIVDTDNDGVPDDLDEFPTDPERAFRSWYPSENQFSTLAYEDLWPGLGDFDFNDVVVDFQYEMITDAKNALKEMNAKYKLMAAGASLNNGFAVSMPFASNKVESIQGNTIVGDAVSFDENGSEAGHSNETVVVVMDAIGTLHGEFLNTLVDRPYVETDTIKINVLLIEAVADFGAAPFNPFIFIGQERGKEVHLIDNRPTEIVNPSFFGTWEDRTDAGSGKYYQTSGRLPWAIEIPVSFDYPIETVDILQTHLKFAAWAMSSGTEYQDWYLDLTGYRNTENIYPKPEAQK